MYYEINISRGGIHLFATAPRSCQSRDKARALLGLFNLLFPPDKYQISVTYYEESGHTITQELLGEIEKGL